MDKHNSQFKANPEKYMGKNAIECYNVKPADLKAHLQAAGADDKLPRCDTQLAFDIIPQKGGYVSLKIIGSRSKYTKSNEEPIFGKWIPYTGQKSYREPYSFGRILLDTVMEDFVFTVGFNGCKLVAVKDPTGLILYHEPTAESWGFRHPDYGGKVAKEAGPEYSDSVLGGFGVVTKRKNKWHAIVQSVQGVKVVKVELVPLEA